MIAKGIAIWVPYRVWDTVNKTWKTGDVANHTLYFIKDGVAALATNAPQEIGNGLYRVLSTAAEVDGLFITLHGTTSSSDCYIIPTHMLTDATTKGVALHVQFMVWDTLNSVPRTVDADNLTMYVAEANANAVATNTPTELSAANLPGLYDILLTTTETDGPIDSVHGSSSTADTEVFSVIFPPNIALEQTFVTPLEIIDLTTEYEVIEL